MKPHKEIRESSKVLRDLMQEHLAWIADNTIQTIMGRLKGLTDSQILNATKDLPTTGIAEYKSELETAMAVISFDALTNVKKELPKGNKIQFSEGDSIQLDEYDSLPPGVKKQIKLKKNLMAETQIDDLHKTISFQFASSSYSTDSLDLMRQDLEDAAEHFITGPTTVAGSSVISSELINQTRNEFFQTDEAREQVDAFEFFNPSPVTPICIDLNGSIFTADDAGFDRFTPPLHFNCESYYRPILKGKLGDREVTGLKPSTKKIEDSIQFDELHRGCTHQST